MDRTELTQRLKPFTEKCTEKGKHLDEICLEEAFVGDSASSYILQVKAKWVDDMYCSDVLDFLFDILWETVDEDTRKNIFAIQVLDSYDQVHCVQTTAY